MFLLTTKTEQQSNCFVRKKMQQRNKYWRLLTLTFLVLWLPVHVQRMDIFIKWTKCFPAREGLLFQVWMDIWMNYFIRICKSALKLFRAKNYFVHFDWENYSEDSGISSTFLLKFWAKNHGCGLYMRPLL